MIHHAALIRALSMCFVGVILCVTGCSSLPQAQTNSRSRSAKPIVFQVNTQVVLRRDANTMPGININYIRDSDSNRPNARPLTTALKDLGVRWLRYPGGEKSDFIRWNRTASSKLRPVSQGAYATFEGARMDLDAFIATCRATGAEPYVVVGFDSFKRTGRTKAAFLKSATELVRYANVEKRYGIKYWEVGNENWHHKALKPEDAAQVVNEFSVAMKAVDPSIQIGASGSNLDWWRRFLPGASQHIDFVSMSLYNTAGWKNYDHWLRAKNLNLVESAERTLDAIQKFSQPADRDRLRLIVAETNSLSWEPRGWASKNSLGHSLVTFDTLGRLLHKPKIQGVFLWGTRWIDDTQAETSGFYALNSKNQILPSGRALALWGQFLEANLVQVEGESKSVTAYAARSKNGSRLTVWVLNRARQPQTNITVSIRSELAYTSAQVSQWSGNGPDDLSPDWTQLGKQPIAASMMSGISVPASSVTVFELRR